MTSTETTSIDDVQEAFSPADVSNAMRMTLRRGPASPQAHAVIQGLMEDVVLPAWPEGKQKRPSSVEAARAALGAIMADLLEFQATGLVGAHGAHRQDFTGLRFAFDIFVRVRDALVAAGLLIVRKGHQQLISFPDREGGGPSKVQSHGGTVARYRLTSLALARVAVAGVPLDAWRDHWGRDALMQPVRRLKPSKAPLLELRAKKEGFGSRSKGRPMQVDFSDPRASAMRQELEEHNAFVMAAGVGGIAFRGLKRLFNDGNQPGFNWQWGGRYYKVQGGEAAETPKSYERLQLIMIGGEPVGEVDLKAAHLCLLYGLRCQSLNAAARDPYAVPGLDRELVKTWVSKALGAGSTSFPIWSKDAREYYGGVAPNRKLSRDVPVSLVRDAVLKVHPILKEAGAPGLSALDFQFHESEIMRKAMADLRSKGIASLPLHDSLVVPISATQAAASAIKEAFARHLEEVAANRAVVTPAVEIKGPKGHQALLGHLVGV